jgi:hypothetical protein
MLKCTLIAVLALFAVLGCPHAASAQTSTDASLLVKLAPGLTPDVQTAVIARNGGVELSSIPALRLHAVVVSVAELAAVKARYEADPLVEHVEDNLVRISEAIPTDPLYTSQWVLPQIGWDQVFGVLDVSGVATVAILDTGVDARHPDLAGVVGPGTSVLDGSNGTTDPSGHGTWLAGIVAARTNATPMEGIAGVGYAGVQVMPVTVLNQDGLGLDSDVIAGVIWAVDHGADVILMAFSDPGFSRNLQDAIDYAWSRGVVIVAAAGNNASSAATFPAGDRGVMGVAATDAYDRLAAFSNSGQAVFIAAPGVDVPTTAIGDGYDVVSGTSTAAAIVAGAAGLMKAQDRSLTNGVIVGRLARNADPAGTQAETGNGRVNLARAMADSSTEFVQPAGAAPVGEGGPFVGPYVSASVSDVKITSPTSPITLASASLPVSISVSFDYSTSTTGTTTARVEVPGTSGSATTQTVASGVGVSATIPLTVPTGTTVGSHNVKVTITNNSGSGANQKNDQINNIIVIIGDTTPPSIIPSVSGTAGANGWYTSNVTVSWIVTDPESTVTSKTGCNPVTLTDETIGTTLTCTATSGGGTASESVTVKLDKTPPAAQLAVTAGTAGLNGWYTSDVTVVTNGSDSVSTPVVCTAAQTVSTETTGTTLNGSCTNDAGLTGQATPLTVKLDKTPPMATLTVTAGTAGTNGWYTSDITVHTSGVDTVSTPVSCTAAQFQTTETTGAVFNGSCTNDAGLTGQAAPLRVKLDKTPPTAALAVVAGTEGANGWYTSDVTIRTSGDDTVSGSVTCTADQFQTTDTVGAVFNGSCTNKAGLTTQATPLPVKLDKTPPTAALAVVAGTLGANGWYTSDVTIRTSGDDTVSGPVTCTADQVQTTDTLGTTFNGSCTNKAGLSRAAAPLTVKLDKTPPTITIDGGGITDGASYYFGYVPAAGSCTATDATSGTATPPGCVVSGYDGSVGPHTLTATANDNAGNPATGTRSYTVLAWTLHGFYQPVEMSGVWNTVKGGSTVPLKFEVYAGPHELTDTSIVSLVATTQVPCYGGTDDPVEMLATGGTSLRYDSVASQFIFNWQTPRVAGQCYRVTLTTQDGSSLSALFKAK